MLQSNNKINDYINSVCNQIQWKKSHIFISKELENHIVDQGNVFIAQGLNEDTAIEKAIAEMGDPVDVGIELNRIHKPRIEWSIIGLTCISLLLGLVIQLFVTTGIVANVGKSIFYSIFGIVIMIVAYLSDYTIIGKYPNKIFFGFLTFVLGISIISSPGIRIILPLYESNSFYTKFVLLLYPTIFTGIIYTMRNNSYLGIFLCGVFMAISYIVFLPFASFSTYTLYSLSSLVLITISILKGWFNVSKIKGLLLTYIPTIIFILISLALINDTYLWNRIINAFFPSLDPMGSGWMAIQSREILSNAKFIGEGLGGNSGYMMPNIDTDFLLTFLIHRFGWISLIIIVSIFALLIIKSLKLCLKQNSILGSLVSLSVVITISTQIAIYIGYNLGFQLISPLTLPLISYGGSGIVINLFLIGIMLSVFKWGNLVNDSIVISSSKKILTINDGKIIIDFKS